MNIDNIYLKYLIRSHTVIGLFVGFFFFLSAYFGTITLFKPYIDTWQNPSRYFALDEKKELNLDVAIKNGLEKLENPNDKVKIELPSFRDNALSMNFGFSKKVYLNPYTGEVLDTQNENNFLSNFFNRMHINLKMSKLGQALIGLSSIGIIFLTITGIYLWLINRKNRTKEKNFWFRWHKDLSLIAVPYILAFTISGAVFGFTLSNASLFTQSGSDGKESNIGKVVRPIIYPPLTKVKKSSEEASMLPFSTLYKKAQSDYPELKIVQISLFKWNDKNAQIAFSGYLKENRILTGKVNRASIVLSAVDGKIINIKGLEQSHGVSKFLSGFYFFHFLPDEGFLVRFIYFIFGIAFSFSLIFGLLIWINKNKSKYSKDKDYFSMTSKFTFALGVGIIPASSFLVMLYWAIPFETLNKTTWLTGAFFAFWSFTLFLSVYCKKTLICLKIFMFLTAIFLFLSIAFHWYRTDIFLLDAYMNKLWQVFYIELSILIFASFSLFFAIKSSKIKFLQRFEGL